MIKYKLFKYVFYRYFIYNLLYILVYFWVPVFFYIVIIKYISFKTQDFLDINELIETKFDIFYSYKFLSQYIDNICKSLIVLFFILFVLGYVYMNKKILEKIFLQNYNNIVIIYTNNNILFSDIILFALLNFTIIFSGFISIMFINNLYPNISITCIYYLQIANYIISWFFTYYLLNKFIKNRAKIKFKLIKI